jgi:hypothetical protein
MINKLTLYKTARYEIEVLGTLDTYYAEWNNVDSMRRSNSEGAHPATILSCTVDQAALLGILRRLYSHGLPLLSVTLVET